jgi:hypothetical protein
MCGPLLSPCALSLQHISVKRAPPPLGSFVRCRRRPPRAAPGHRPALLCRRECLCAMAQPTSTATHVRAPLDAVAQPSSASARIGHAAFRRSLALLHHSPTSCHCICPPRHRPPQCRYGRPPPRCCSPSSMPSASR